MKRRNREKVQLGGSCCPATLCRIHFPGASEKWTPLVTASKEVTLLRICDWQCLSIGERSDSKLQNQDLSSWKGSLLMIKPRWAIIVSLSLLRSVFHSRRKTKKVHILRAKLNQSTVLQMCKCRSTKEPWRNKTNKQKQKNWLWYFSAQIQNHHQS